MANKKFTREKKVVVDYSGKVPPQSLDIERTVLGSILIDKNALDSAMEYLTEECFYSTQNQKTFRAIRDLFRKDMEVDILVLAEELRKREWLEDIGGEAYLSELVDGVATSANVVSHVKILESKAMLRSLITAAAEISTDCFSPDAESREIVDKAEAKIFGIAEKNIKSAPEPMRDLLSATFEEIEQFGKGGGPACVKTGFTQFDDMTTGLHAGDLVIIAARPGMGKTSFVLSVCMNTAMRMDKKSAVVLFSLEMSKAQLAQRMLCAEAQIDIHRLRSGRLSKRELNTLGIAAGPLHEAPIYIDDTPGINVMEIRAKCRRLKARGALDVIVIDYLQLMEPVERLESRQQEVSATSRALKNLGKELGVPVVALSQLSRAVETRTGDHKPQLSDLRESGAIEQDADLVMFIYRGAKYYPEDESLKNVAELIIAKQRNGPTGSVILSFIDEFATFKNLDTIHAEPEEEVF